MKKKLSAIILATAMVATLSACGTAETEGTEPATQPETQQVEQQETQETQESQAAKETQEQQETEAAATDAFDQFKDALDDAGYTYEVTQMAAEMVGAERGEKYTFDFGSVEMYRFPDGADALTSGEVTLEGFGAFPVEVNGNYGLVVSLTENEDAIMAIFEAL